MLPEEAVYADDTDFINEDEARRNVVVEIAAETLLTSNLQVNDDKTEHTVIERGDRNTERWRYVKKVGSLIGDAEDIANTSNCCNDSDDESVDQKGSYQRISSARIVRKSRQVHSNI
jgi:hypothetical protein